MIHVKYMKVLGPASCVFSGRVFMKLINKTNNVRAESNWVHIRLGTQILLSWEEKLSAVYFPKNSSVELYPSFLRGYTGVK